MNNKERQIKQNRKDRKNAWMGICTIVTHVITFDKLEHCVLAVFLRPAVALSADEDQGGTSQQQALHFHFFKSC